MKQYTPEELNKLSKEEIAALLMQSQNEAAIFRARLEELQMHLFHRSTERLECLGQESAFNEAEVQSTGTTSYKFTCTQPSNAIVGRCDHECKVYECRAAVSSQAGI